MTHSFHMYNLRNESVLSSFYHDAFIHTEDKKIFNVHKVMLAMYSPFLHGYFQSRPGNQVNDIFFQNANSRIVKPAIELIYNGMVTIDSEHLTPFKYFIETTLQIQLQETPATVIPNTVQTTNFPSEQNCNNQTANEIERKCTSSSKTSYTEQTKNDSEDTQKVEDGAAMTIFNEKEDFKSSLDSGWTLTTLSEDKLMKIKHSVSDALPNKRRNYKCNICGNMTKEFIEASKHFLTKHQTYVTVKEQLESARDARRRSLTELNSIKNDIEKECDIDGARDMLEHMRAVLSKHLSITLGIEKTKPMSENFSRKSRELTNSLNSTLKEIHCIIDYINKK